MHYWEMHLVHLSAQEFVHNSAFPGLAHASAQVFPIVHKHVRKLYKKCTNWKLLRMHPKLKCCELISGYQNVWIQFEGGYYSGAESPMILAGCRKINRELQIDIESKV